MRNMTTMVVTIALLALTDFGYAAPPPSVEWSGLYKGGESDTACSIRQTDDGGYIVAGKVENGTCRHDLMLLKLDSGGKVVWCRFFGGTGTDEGSCVRQTNDGGYIIVGWTDSFGAGGKDVYLIRTDAAGHEIWARTFGGPGDDVGTGVVATDDGGFAVAGYGDSCCEGRYDALLIRTDGNGTEIWSQIYGTAASEKALSLDRTADGGYILAGEEDQSGAPDVYLIKINEFGHEEWSRSLGGSWSEAGRSIKQTADGGYVVAGYTLSYGAGSSDVYLLKTDPAGTLLWQRTFGGADRDEGYSVDLTPHGGFVISGFSCSFGNGSDIYLIKTDRDGIEEWSDLFGGSLEDEGRAGQQTADGGYVVAGFDREGAGMSYASVIKLQAEDRRIWSRTYGVSSRDEAFSVQQTLDSGYIMAGWTWSDALNTPDAFLVKTDQAGNTVWARRFGGSGWDGARSLLGVEDGYVFSGVTDPGEGTFYDAWLVKTDFSGTQVWSQTYDAGAYEWADCVSRTWDGGFVLAGRTGPLGPDPLSDLDVYWVRTNSKGEHIWIRSISGPGDEWASCVQQTLDGGFILAGATNSWGNRGYEVFLLKTTSAGFIQGQQTFGGTEDDYGRAVLQTSSGGFIVAGSTTSLGAGGSDIYLIKTDPWLNLLWQKTFGGPDDEEAFSLVQTSNGNFAVCGWSESFGPGDRNAIVVEFDGNGDPIWSGIFGGMKDDWVRSLVQTRDRGYAAAGGTTSFGVTGTDCYLLKLAPDESYPIVDIRANGLDGPMEIKAGDWLEVSLTLEPNDLKGEVADWWVVADTAAGWYFYDPFRGWVPGVGVTFNGALFELNRFAVFRTNTLPPDLYRFYFGFDTVPDGRPDPGSPYRDVVGVVVTP